MHKNIGLTDEDMLRIKEIGMDMFIDLSEDGMKSMRDEFYKHILSDEVDVSPQTYEELYANLHVCLEDLEYSSDINRSMMDINKVLIYAMQLRHKIKLRLDKYNQ